MQIVDFDKRWLDQAKELVLANSGEERAYVPVLPDNAPVPPLGELAENGLGAAMVEDGKLLGFLGAYGPWKPVFCTKDVSGVFSPLHAHGVQKQDRVKIWRKLYQAAAEKWVKAGAASHAITLHAHDADAREALYLYGFGVRCMDLMRPMESIDAASGWQCCELASEDQYRVTPLRRELASHLAKSPCFMRDDAQWLENWLQKKEQCTSRLFVAEHDGHIIGYIEADVEGENYLSSAPGTMNICGAYCLPEYRGTGAAQTILDRMIAAFRGEGYLRLGVDCESFNPTALGFWSKYFTAYTHSVVRRIDENALEENG